MSKRSTGSAVRTSKKMKSTNDDDQRQEKEGTSFFRATETADDAHSLKDGVLLKSALKKKSDVILPWVGFGTYKLAKDIATETVLSALAAGYRSIDTAFIYAGETTERRVGDALQTSLQTGLLRCREEVFITTKHWRKYHGYEETLQCLNLSLKRLQLDYVDLYLMHWPGPAWTTMNRRNDIIAAEGPWYYAAEKCKDPAQMAQLRSETWRAMEDALKAGKVRSIGVSNFTVEHLKALKETAKVWPPSVNQVELHPLYPQLELLKYCQKEGIVVQAYASLGGQDTGKKQWNKLGLEGDVKVDDECTPEVTPSEGKMGKKKPKKKKLKETVVSLLSCHPVVSLARELKVTPAQILLRWALSQNCVVIPKASSKDRMTENAGVLSFSLTQEQIANLTESIQSAMAKAIEAASKNESLSDDDKLALQTVGDTAMGRLCWRSDPLRHLSFP